MGDITKLGEYRDKKGERDSAWLKSVIPIDAEHESLVFDKLINKRVDGILHVVMGDEELSDDDFDLALNGYLGYVILNIIRKHPAVIHSKGFNNMVYEFAGESS